MVDTTTVTSPNGVQPDVDDDATARRLSLPDAVCIPMAEMRRFPSPGTQRALKAQTGRDYLEMVGPNADSADRTQTQVWTHLRRTVPGLRWDECDEVALEIPEGDAAVDPTVLASFGGSPPSADSGE